MHGRRLGKRMMPRDGYQRAHSFMAAETLAYTNGVLCECATLVAVNIINKAMKVVSPLDDLHCFESDGARTWLTGVAQLTQRRTSSTNMVSNKCV